MEVVGFVFAALGFVDQAISVGQTMRQLAIQYPAVGRTIVASVVRLESDKYTLELWYDIWTKKARQRGSGQIEELLQDIWGRRGYLTIIECLGQLNIKLGEAYRTLKTIDPDSFASFALLSPDNASGTHLSRQASDASSHDSESKSPGSPQKYSKGKKKRWYHRLSSATSLPDRTVTNDGLRKADAKAQLAQDKLNLKLSPGTKFKWSMALKDELRLTLTEIDEWMQRLQSLAERCEEHRNAEEELSPNIIPKNIRSAAGSLHSGLFYLEDENFPPPHIIFKLERERFNSEYFNDTLGQVSYIDHSSNSIKFPFLVTNSKCKDIRYVLMAEGVPAESPKLKALKTMKFESIMDQLRLKPPEQQFSSCCLWWGDYESGQIVIHNLKRQVQPTKRPNDELAAYSLREWLAAKSVLDPLMFSLKRLQLACTLAISILHLYGTGWISTNSVSSNDMRLSGGVNEEDSDTRLVSLFMAHVKGSTASSETPFSCLMSTMQANTTDQTGEYHKARLFHYLGIVLFELGHGKVYGDQLQSEKALTSARAFGRGLSHSNSYSSEWDKLKLLSEIDKIPFGRAYRDLVKTCLTGKIFRTMGSSVDVQFNKVVVERLNNLEKHFSAIVSGE